MLIKYWPRKLNIPFMKFNWLGVVVSIIVVAGSLFLLATRGLNLGVDFSGGSLIELAVTDKVTETTVKNSGIEGLTVNTATLTSGQKVVVIRFSNLDESLLGADFAKLSETEKVSAAPSASSAYVKAALKQKFALQDTDFLRQDTVGPKVSSELLRDSLIALGLAILMMLAYVGFRFEWQYGLGGIVALFHDAIGTLGLWSLTQWEFNLTTVAALLTIIGYSINDTVVVFDRVREDRRKYKTMPAADLVNMAVNETLSRTFLTSSMTLLSILAVLLFGGPVLSGMAIAMIFGIIIGTYSSIFVASAIVIFFGLGFRGKDHNKVEGFQVPQ